MEEIVERILKEYPNIKYRIHSKFNKPFYGYMIFDGVEYRLFSYIIIDGVLYVEKDIIQNNIVLKYTENDLKEKPPN